MAKKKTYEVRDRKNGKLIGSFTLRIDELDELEEELNDRNGGCGDVKWIIYRLRSGRLDWGPLSCRPVDPEIIDITTPFCTGPMMGLSLEQSIVSDIREELQYR